MNKYFFTLVFLFSSSLGADATCVGMTNVPDLESNVSQNGPVRFFGCPCNCAQHRWLSNTTCIECNHKHAGAIALGNRQLTPEWFHGLVEYVLNKVTEEEKRLKIAYSEQENNYYERPHEGESPQRGGGMLGGTFGEDDTSSSSNVGTTSTNDPNSADYNYDNYNPDWTDFYQGQSATSPAFDGPSVGDSGDWDSNGVSGSFNFGM